MPGEALQPHRARLVVPVLHAAPGLADLIRTHGRVTHDDHAIVGVEGAQHLAGRRARRLAAPVVLPQVVIRTVVEVEVLEVPELAAGGREQFLADAHVLVHRPAHVQQEQHLDGIAPLGDQLQVQPSGVARGGGDGPVEVEFVCRTLAREFPQPAQGQLQVAGTQLHRVVEITVLAAVPDLDGAPLALALRPDADPLRVVAARAERRSAAGADPLAAALVALLLLLEAFAQGLEEFLPAAQRLDLRALLLAEHPLRHQLQPVCRQLGDDALEELLGAGEMLRERAVETVEKTFVLHQGQAGEVVELLGRAEAHPRLQCRQQRQQFGDRDRDAGLAQVEKETDQHGAAVSVPRGGPGTPAVRRGARPARSSAAHRTAAGSTSGDRRCAAPPAESPRRAAA